MKSFRNGVSLAAFAVTLIATTPTLADGNRSLSFDEGLTFSRSFTVAPQDTGGHLSDTAAEAQGYTVLKAWSSIADGTAQPSRFAAVGQGSGTSSVSQNYSLADAMSDAIWRKRVAQSLWGN